MTESCPYCPGTMPTRRNPGIRPLMCRACWRLVPLPLRQENQRCIKDWDAYGKPLQPPKELADRWSDNVGECRRYIVVHRMEISR